MTELCPTHESAPQLASAAGVLGLSYLPLLAGSGWLQPRSATHMEWVPERALCGSGCLCQSLTL